MIALTVNARAVKASVEPRTHLADFLRDGLDLTGTHLGCEHGVCGACTLLLDDMPARSCITYAVACDGARVTTIEGLDDDEITIELRAAFTREHALQCGYCTPGMLISARDLVLRLPVPDERQIRVGLSGNLCRCTGYVGIVRAVRAVIDHRRQRGILPVPGGGRTSFGPVGSGNGATASISNVAKAPTAKAEPRADDSGAMAIPDFTPEKILEDHFTVAYPPERVFDMFGDVAKVAACLPGASLTGVPTPARVGGMIRVRLGPISANFRGAARIERDLESLSGRILGIGSDQRSRSSTQGEIRYRLVATDQGAATRVELSIGYSLRGMLAQIAREGLVRDLAARLTADFARNLERQLSGIQPDGPAAEAHILNGVSLLIGLLRTRARRTLQRVLGRKRQHRWYDSCSVSTGNSLLYGGRHDEFRAACRHSQHRTHPRCRPGLDRAAADVDLGRGEHRAGQLGARRARRQSDGAQPLRVWAARCLPAERADVPDDAGVDRGEHLLPGEDLNGHSGPVWNRRHVGDDLRRHHDHHGAAGRHRHLRLLRDPHLREVYGAADRRHHGTDERSGLEPAGGCQLAPRQHASPWRSPRDVDTADVGDRGGLGNFLGHVGLGLFALRAAQRLLDLRVLV